MTSYISTSPMTIEEVMRVTGWQPFKTRWEPFRDPRTGELIRGADGKPKMNKRAVKSRKPVAPKGAAGLTNGKSYAWGGEFTATDSKVHVWFDFFSGNDASEFEEKLDLVSDWPFPPNDVDRFYALAGDENILTLELE